MELMLDRGVKKVNKVSKVNLFDRIIFFFMFLSTLFIGADIIGINVGVNFRFDQILLAITTILMLIKNRFKIYNNKWIFLFLGFSLISVIFAINTKRSVLFYFSIVYNVVFIYLLYANFVRTYGPKIFLKIFRYTMYIQFLLMVMQFALKVFLNYEFPFMPSYGKYMGIERFSLWFYEPSYLSTFVTIWFVISFYFLLICGSKSYIKDVIMAGLMVLMSTSSSGFIMIALTILTVYALWIIKDVNIKKIVTLVLLIVSVVVFLLVFRNIFDVFIKRLFVNSLDDSSGGRITQWKETFDVFKDNILFGVGPGNYGQYLGFENNYVPSNVTLELMATLGIFSAISFYMITLSLIVRGYKVYKKNRKRNRVLFAFIVALVLFTIILQINQGYLRLYHWMLFGIVEGLIIYYKKNSFELKRKVKYGDSL